MTATYIYNVLMVFAGPVDFGPWSFVYFLIIGVIVAIPILAIGFFIYTITRKIRPGNNKASPQGLQKNSQKLFAVVFLVSIAYLAFYFTNTNAGSLLVVPYLVVVTLLITRMNKIWAIRSAVVVIVALTLFAYNHYPQYSGRDCKDYPSFLECRTPRFSL